MRRSLVKKAAVLMSAAMVLTGCSGTAGESGRGKTRAQAEQDGKQQDREDVIVVMGPNSEPEAGFDPAYGWGAGEHVHEPLIQSTLTVTNKDLTIGYDLATDMKVSSDGLIWTVTIRDDVLFTDGERLTARMWHLLIIH